ncbi:MAG: hypothetical protein JWO59_790 [Chloroflexi bacterium]|nr:hypothetical protein [Chloroflexota bacterium]MDB5076763.1 hypothetical protein [Chloroflexota bacterium]
MAAVNKDRPTHGTLGLHRSQLLDMCEKLLQASLLDERIWVMSREVKDAYVISYQGREVC